MADADCVEFLQWALPRLGRRWAGYRKVRRQVCRRVRRRAEALGLSGLGDYRALLERDEREWQVLDGLLNVTISRFYRDRGVFDAISSLLPSLASARGSLQAWSAGCAGGEEPYTLALIAEFDRLPIDVVGTDIDPTMLERARTARYGASSLRELPAECREAAFDRDGDEFVLRDRFRQRVRFARHDMREPPPERDFDLVLCRYGPFTYFGEVLQRQVLEHLATATRPGGALVIGTHEHLPLGQDAFQCRGDHSTIFTRRG